MSFLKFFRHETQAESVALIDIGADSVAGAYARYAEGEMPALLYTRRLPIEVRDGEPHERAMLRALSILGDELIREGAPILMHTTGSGSATNILVSIDMPWQETSVRVEKFERKDSFIFTKSMVAAALEKTSTVPPEKFLADESIVGAILNGYETHDPYGKKIRRASIIVLTSLIDKTISESIISTLRGLFHTKRIASIAGKSLRYQAMRIAFPHERDALILDATGPLTSIVLVRKNLFTALIEVQNPTADVQLWTQTVASKCTELAGQYPLPRIIFLIAREPDVSSLQQALTEMDFSSLWLSDNPPKIISVLASHIVGLIRHAATTPPDVSLLLMALYYQQCFLNEK